MRNAWSDLRLRAEPGFEPLTVRAGPFQTGITEVEAREVPNGGSEMCTTVRRTEPYFDGTTGRLTLVHSFELLGESAQTQTITYAADGMLLSSTVAASAATEVPLAAQVCEPFEPQL